MRTGELGGTLGDDVPAQGQERHLGRGDNGLGIPEILDVTDRLLGERGRRSHLFTWLRRPGGGPADWLAVDAYYPGNRVVVVCQVTADPYREVFAELIPAHGLRLLEIDQDALVGGRESARRALEQRVAQLGPLPERSAAPVNRSQVPATATSPQSQVSRPSGDRHVARVLAGFALTAVLVAEVYAGVARAGFDSGNVLLAFGLALDACSRGLGTIAASREGSSEWAWWCALGGSPVVVWFALFQAGGPVRTEPAPLGGLIGILALVVLAVTLLAGVI
ncbi:MAG: hypothetical protein ACTHQQ_09370 [Solirubrobacteraceae bacterium]